MAFCRFELAPSFTYTTPKSYCYRTWIWKILSKGTRAEVFAIAMQVITTLVWKNSSRNWIIFGNFKLRLNLSFLTWKRLSLHSRKDGIIEFLLVQLVLHNESKFETSNDSDTESKSNQKTIETATTNFFQQFSWKWWWRKLTTKSEVTVIADSLFNWINEKGFFKKHDVKIEKVPGVTTDENGLLDETATLVGQKLDCVIVYASTNDITKGINSLNMVKKMERKVKNSLPNTRLAFSSLVLQNNKKYFSRKVSDGWENYCSQTKFDFIDNQSQKITFERSSN